MKEKCLFILTSLISITFFPFSAHAGIPRCASSGQTPVTSSYLRQIATYRGIINSDQSTLTQNRRIGRAFQELVQRSMGFTGENWFLFASPERQAEGGPKSVRPDFTERVVKTTSEFDLHGSFVEVKATGATLTLGYYRHQIRGHIDAVSRRPARSFQKGAARVLFVTTSDTSAGPTDTLDYANLKGVSIWKAIVCTTAQPGGYLQVGPATPLNSSIYGTNIPLDGFPGKLNDLALPGTAPADLEDANGGY